MAIGLCASRFALATHGARPDSGTTVDDDRIPEPATEVGTVSQFVPDDAASASAQATRVDRTPGGVDALWTAEPPDASPEENDDGEQVASGPDGRLHLGLGNHGGALDPHRTAQDERSELGELLAADIDAASRPRRL